MKVFLDTNVILDHALDREHCYASEATIILEWCASGMLKDFISSGSVYTLTYVLERAGYRGRGLRQKLQAYLSWVRPLASDEVCSGQPSVLSLPIWKMHTSILLP